MSTHLINHLRTFGGVPNEDGLPYPEQVEAAQPYGHGRSLWEITNRAPGR
ncbi:hypothetical protein [Micromonospora sp. NPDC004704]